MAGWGSYQPRKKSPAALALERRRELGLKFPSDIDELIALAAKCRKKPKVLPPAPHPDDDTPDLAPTVVGPCQAHVANVKAWRAAKAARAAPVVVEEEPYVDERDKKLAAAREYNRERYVPRSKKS